MAVPCEHGNLPAGAIKDGEFLDYLSDHYFLKRHFDLR
jgi:hypothetical protein